MAEKTDGNGAVSEAPQVRMQILGQFIRDLSFENIVAQKGLTSDAQPDVNVGVSLDAKKRTADNQYEVVSKYKVTAKSKDGDATLFIMELDYGGVFLIENVPNEQLHPFLMIECPRLLFPFARQIIHTVIREGGFPPLNLDNIDWVALYRQNLAQQQAQAKASPKA